MNRKLAVKSALLVLAIVVLYAGYAWFKEWTKDPDRGSTDTTDYIAAVEYIDGGSRVVVFDDNGKKTVVPDAVEGRSDVDPVWRPDGQRVFFSSNRKGTSNNIFRWNIATNEVEQRLEGSRSAGSPHFGPSGWPNLADSGLITLGGSIFDFNQREKRTLQILPPIEFEKTRGAEEGQLETVYQQIGTSFKSAKWGVDRKVMFTVMRREDDEVFLINYMEPWGDQPVGPVPAFAGSSIQFDVAPDGTAVVAIQDFAYVDPTQIPAEYMVGGRATKPWRNGLFAVRVMDDGKLNAFPLFTDQPDLGIEPAEITAEARTEVGIPANVSGILVANVGAGTAAERLAFKPGDVVMSIGGKPTANYEGLMTALTEVRLGIETSIEYWSKQDGAVKTVPYTFGSESSMCLRDPAISPDSKSVAAVLGLAVDRYNFESRELVVIPIDPMGVGGARRLVAGRVFEPNWHPSGEKLAFAMVGPSGDSQIYVIGADGAGQKAVSTSGEYGSPKFSPMLRN